MRRCHAVSLALLFTALWPGNLTGQGRGREDPLPFVVVGQRDLKFGRLFRGTQRSIPPTANRAAVFGITAGQDLELQLTFILPAAMFSPEGEALPLVFGPGDGIVEKRGGPRARAFAFDPAHSVTTVVEHVEHLFVRLGGTAAPTVTQSLGRYRGTIVVIVADLGT